MQLSMCEIEFNTKKKSRHNNVLKFSYYGLNNNYIQRYFLIHGLLNSMCSKHNAVWNVYIISLLKIFVNTFFKKI